MAYAPAAIAPRDIAISQPAARRGLMSRLLDALMAARMRQAEREIAAISKTRRPLHGRNRARDRAPFPVHPEPLLRN